MFRAMFRQKLEKTRRLCAVPDAIVLWKSRLPLFVPVAVEADPLYEGECVVVVVVFNWLAGGQRRDVRSSALLGVADDDCIRVEKITRILMILDRS